MHSLEIEKENWKFSIIQDQNGDIVYCSKEESENYPDAEVLDLTVSLDSELITFTTTDEIYEGTYRLDAVSKDSLLYTIIINYKEYDAITSYQTGSHKYKKLIVRQKDHTITFTNH